MPKIRVLIVDGTAVVRGLVSDVLSRTPLLEIVGSATNGRLGLARIPQLNPDLVILGIEMQEMGGFETLVEIRKGYPHLPVIMFSTHTNPGTSAISRALALGANDCVTLPSITPHLERARRHIRTEWIPKIKALCSTTRTDGPLPPRSASFSSSRSQQIDIVAIGASTGGPNALTALLPQLPADFPVPIVVVQHMPAVFTKHLADRLASKSAIDAFEGRSGDILRPGCAWVAPGDYHMVLARKASAVCLQTHQAAPVNFCRPSVDVLFTRLLMFTDAIRLRWCLPAWVRMG